jgi:hypothetical protein
MWETKLVKSRRFGGEMIPTFFISKVPSWNKSDNNFKVIIGDVSEDEWDLIKESNLNLLDDIGKFIETSVGRILLDDRYSGDVFVSGLFVCHGSTVTCGYDFKPNYIKLDRDRGLVDSFDLKWNSSAAWSNVVDTDLLSKYLSTPDCAYIISHGIREEALKGILKNFVDKYGEKAIPVINDEDKNHALRCGRIPIIVSESLRNALMKSSDDMSLEDLDDENTGVVSRLENLRNSILEKLTTDEAEELDAIITDLKDLLD